VSLPPSSGVVGLSKSTRLPLVQDNVLLPCPGSCQPDADLIFLLSRDPLGVHPLPQSILAYLDCIVSLSKMMMFLLLVPPDFSAKSGVESSTGSIC